MKIIKAIKLQRRLRKLQEELFHKCCKHSQQLPFQEAFPRLHEYGAVNRAVRKVNNKLPGIYFFISDLFGLYNSLRYVPETTDFKLSSWEPIMFDLIPNEPFHK